MALAAKPGAPDLEIVTKPKEPKGFEVLPRRWIVERWFGIPRRADVGRRTMNDGWRARGQGGNGP